MREVIAEYTAEDVYSTKRAEIQDKIRQRALVPALFNFATGDRQKAPEIAPLFNAFQRAGPRPENSFLYLLGHIDLASIRASSAP